MKNFNKKISIILIILNIILGSVLINPNKLNAGSPGWYYWSGSISNEIGPFSEKGYEVTEKSCMYKFINDKTLTKSSGCYWNYSVEVSSVVPTSGTSGDTVIIQGLGYSKENITSVTFNGIPSTSFSVTSEEKISAVVPEGATSGYINVISKTNGTDDTPNAYFMINTSIAISGNSQEETSKYDNIYNLLAPIGDLKQIKTDNVGAYFNLMIKIAIGLCAVLSVIMLIVNGFVYMGEESIFGKAQSKEKMISAILGLFIALGSYAILNTINPDLLGGKGIKIDKVSIEIIDKPDAGDNTIDSDFKTGNESYSSSGDISYGITEAVSKLKNGINIKSFNVFVLNKAMTITMSDGSSTQPVSINIGQNGYSEIGAGYSGDNKTPKGSWKILEIRQSKNNKPVFSKKGSNMGASFWLLNPTTNGDRGIGMHGNKNGSLTPTNGCIRLKNSDILALLPYIKTGISVSIQ